MKGKNREETVYIKRGKNVVAYLGRVFNCITGIFDSVGEV